MRRALLSVWLVLFALIAPAALQAQSWVNQPFDARNMSREDTATLQAALAYTGDYYGYIDGVWNDGSQSAFVSYVQRVRGASQPLFSDIRDLVLFLEDERVKHNWQVNYSPIANTSYLYPYGYMEAVEGKNEEEYLSTDGHFSLIIREGDLNGVKADHDWFLNKAVAGKEPFHYKDDVLWITWADIENGMTAYARSDLNQGKWTTMSAVVNPEAYFRLNLMAGSTLVGNNNPGSLIWTSGGVIDQVINGASSSAPPVAAAGGSRPEDQVDRPGKAAVADTPPWTPPETPPAAETSPPAGDLVEVTPGPAPGEKPAGPILGTPAPGGTPELPKVADAGPGVVTETPDLGTAPGGPAPIRAPEAGGETAAADPMPKVAPVAETPKPKVSGTLKGSGTGFYITRTTLLTAAHVIEGCSAVGLADGTPLEILAADPSLDVAVLGGAPDVGAWLKLSALEVPKLGENVTALGYPYSTSLDQGLTVTSGNVSALRGIDGSSNRVMITAPVQPGNSGGPLLNKKGAVIGVVVSRVDDMAMLKETGTLPQNMNFAVPSGPLITFLAKHRISRPQGDGVGGDLSVELPRAYEDAVVPLHCFK